MEKQKNITGVTFPGEVFITADDPDLVFDRAREMAIARARTYDTDPMLLAWYDSRRDAQSPDKGCEEKGGDPGWVNYAKGHGGNLTINVNHGEYIFMFREELPFQKKNENK